MDLLLPAPEGALPPSPSFTWLDPCFHLETLLPLSHERDGWLRHERLLRRLLSLTPLASDLHDHVLSFLHPRSFCHAFVPVAVPCPFPNPLISHGPRHRPLASSLQSAFGGDDFIWPARGRVRPHCEAGEVGNGKGCGQRLTLLFQLRVGDFPAAMAAAVCPASAAPGDALQCFVCLRCHAVEQSHPVPHCTRWVQSRAQRLPHVDPSAGFTVELHGNGADVIAALRRFDAQRCWPYTYAVLPRMRLSHWLRIATRPSRKAQSEALGRKEEAELQEALKEERKQWGCNSATPHVVRMSGYEAHRSTPRVQRCSRMQMSQTEWSEAVCGRAMHLLLTFPTLRLLPVQWHRGHDLWMYQCPTHLDHFVLTASN